MLNVEVKLKENTFIHPIYAEREVGNWYASFGRRSECINIQ